MIAILAAIGLFASGEPSLEEVTALQVQSILNDHVTKYQKLEYFSGASLSILVPGKKIDSYYAGKVSHEPSSPAVSEKTLFQIGSITKSFTAALMLQLEKEAKLRLEDSLSTYLPKYAKWGSYRLDTLLNMTSCLPNYTDTPFFNVAIVQTPEKFSSSEELIGYVYPDSMFTPPLRSGYFYSNTGYVLADMIIEKTTGTTFKQQIEQRLVKPSGLNNTFYPVPALDKEQFDRMAHGYQYNIYDNPALLGADVKKTSMSWAGAAGALVSTTEDVAKWVHALFMGTLLDDVQKQKLMALHSTKTGKPIKAVTKDDPDGFALGVAAKFHDESFWFYEGKTMGFRAVYMYVPSTHIVVAAAFNSSPDAENDHAHELLINVYKRLQK